MFFGKCSSPDNALGRLKSYLCTLPTFTVKEEKREGGCFLKKEINKKFFIPLNACGTGG